jgi:RNA-dependent RNA polymerase
MQILMGIRKPLSQVLEEASAVYVVNHEHAMFNMERGYPPSLHFAMTIALPQLCDIYSRNVAEGGAAPYSSAPSVRNKLLRHS